MADLATARRNLEKALKTESECECGTVYCPHVALAIDAAWDLLAAMQTAPATTAEKKEGERGK